jgi:hypothetical protein
MLNRKLGLLCAALLLAACGSSGSQEVQQATEVDPKSCQGRWAFEIVNNSNDVAVVFWSPSVMQTRERVGEVLPRDNRIWFKRSPVDEVPEVWVEHQGATILATNAGALRTHRLQAAVACDPRPLPDQQQ